MIRKLPPQAEVELIVGYFWERLGHRSEVQPKSPAGVDLSKGPAFYARRELMQVRDSQALIDWANRWVAMDDWGRARDIVRSRRYQDRNKLSRVGIRRETRDLLDHHARAHGLTLWKYLAGLGLTDTVLTELEQAAGMLAPPSVVENTSDTSELQPSCLSNEVNA